MAIDNEGIKEQAKAWYLQGIAIAEIARRLNMSRKQVGRWKKDDDWDALKIPKPDRPLKIVSFDHPRDPQPQPTAKAKAPGNYDTLEGQLEAIDHMLAAAKTSAYSSIPQEFAAAINGFCRLLELRNKLQPLDNEELIREVIKRYRTPRKAAQAFREAGWHDSA